MNPAIVTMVSSSSPALIFLAQRLTLARLTSGVGKILQPVASLMIWKAMVISLLVNATVGITGPCRFAPVDNSDTVVFSGPKGSKSTAFDPFPGKVNINRATIPNVPHPGDKRDFFIVSPHNRDIIFHILRSTLWSTMDISTLSLLIFRTTNKSLIDWPGRHCLRPTPSILI